MEFRANIIYLLFYVGCRTVSAISFGCQRRQPTLMADYVSHQCRLGCLGRYTAILEKMKICRSTAANTVKNNLPVIKNVYQVATVMLVWNRIALPQIDHSPGGSGPSSNTWFVVPHKSTLQTASRSVQPFLQGSRSWPTKTQIDHAAPVAIGHILYVNNFIKFSCDLSEDI